MSRCSAGSSGGSGAAVGWAWRRWCCSAATSGFRPTCPGRSACAHARPSAARASWTDAASCSTKRPTHSAAGGGGSTITQQLARGFLLDPDLAQRRSPERKLREAVLALKLTATYPKDEILALYLNQIYYGGMA